MDAAYSAEGKTLSILGDSYSTFAGYIPEGQATYYPRPEAVPDVLRVEDTWWHQLAASRGMRILANDSYSGSTMCATGSRRSQRSSCACTGRCRARASAASGRM